MADNAGQTTLAVAMDFTNLVNAYEQVAADLYSRSQSAQESGAPIKIQQDLSYATVIVERELEIIRGEANRDWDAPACEHDIDMYAPHCTEIRCWNYAGKFVN